jgi:hypothetical protein
MASTMALANLNVLNLSEYACLHFIPDLAIIPLAGGHGSLEILDAGAIILEIASKHRENLDVMHSTCNSIGFLAFDCSYPSTFLMVVFDCC